MSATEPVHASDISQYHVDETAKYRHEPRLCCQKYDTCTEPCTPRGRHLAKREWVGLTDADFYGQSELQVMAMKYAEAKLKEKNT